jgi:hypothetical protein
MNKYKLFVLIILVGSTSFAGVGHSTNYYVAQYQTGRNTGADCANAYSAAWFNREGNWGSGAGEIKPGDTVHICGTWTGTAGSTLLTFQASGTEENVTTLLFEPGAVLQAPYFSAKGAISASDKSYIRIDGGSNGIIQNTDNGSSASGKSYHAASQGIYLTECSNIEVANLTIRNIFINRGGDSSSATDTSGQSTAGIRVEGPPFSDLNIHDNKISSARTGVSISVDSSTTSSNINVYNNTTSDHCWGIQVGSGNENVSATGINVYNNDITDWTLWQFPTNTYHTDGIIIYSDGSGSNVTGSVYGNYVHGDLGSGSPTAFIFLESNTKGFNIYNNITAASAGASAWTAIWSGGDTCSGGGHNIFNNTFIGAGTRGGSLVRSCNTIGNIFRNNIFSNAHAGVMCRQNSYGCIASSDFNLFDTSYAIADNDIAGPPYYLGLDEWQSEYKQDKSSKSGDPLFAKAGVYTLQAASPAVNAGTNLTNLKIPTMNQDKSNNPRPSTGAWTIGAYQTGRQAPSHTP